MGTQYAGIAIIGVLIVLVPFFIADVSIPIHYYFFL